MILSIQKILVSTLLTIKIIIFVVVCLGFSLTTLSNAKIIVENDYSVSVESIKFEFDKNISDIKLKIYKIHLDDLKYGKQYKIISDGYVVFNLNLIYQKLKKAIGGVGDEAIFYFCIKEIDLDCLAEFKSSRQVSVNKSIDYLYFKQETFWQNVVSTLNKYYIKNLKVDLYFKKLDLSKFERIKNFLGDNSVSIHKLSFSTIDSNHKYIGNITINYQLNNYSNNLNALIIRHFDKPADLQMRIYSYLNGVFQLNSDTKLSSNDFIQLFINSNFDNRLFLFDVDFNRINVEKRDFFSNPFEVVDGFFSGFYDGDNIIYDIAKIRFSIANNNSKYKFSGSLRKDKFFELSLISHDTINSRLILDYWPVKFRSKLYGVLDKIIQDGSVKDVNFTISALPDKESFTAPKIKLNLKVLDCDIKYDEYKFFSHEINLALDENHTSIKSNKATFNRNINLTDIDIKIPFDSSASEIKFNLQSNGSALRQAIEKKVNKKFDLSGGEIRSAVKINIPHANNLRPYDILIDCKWFLKKISFNDKLIESKKMDFSYKKGKISLKGDFIYDQIAVKNLKLSAAIEQNRPFKIQSLNCKVPLSQKRIQSMLDKIQIELGGTLDIHMNENNKFKLNLSEIYLEKKFGLAKKVGDFGELEFILDNKAFKNIKLLLADVEMDGEILLSNDLVTSAEMKFKKFHNSSFDLKYIANSEYENEYIIDGKKIDLSDISKMMEKQKSSPTTIDQQKSSKISVKTKFLVDDKKDFMTHIDLSLLLNNNKIIKIDGFGYGPTGYVRVFFDEPIVALIINNTGYFMKHSFNLKSLQKGNLELYGILAQQNNKLKFSGELYQYNFKLVESYLLSIFLKICAVTGFSLTSVLQMVNNGIDFSSMHCFVEANEKSILFDKCQAFSNAMLLSLEAKVQLDEKKGHVEGLIIPKTGLNVPIILLQQILSKKGKTLLDGMDDKQNFSISWQNNEKPVVTTNTISFLLPSIFSNLFSKRKTIKNQLNS